VLPTTVPPTTVPPTTVPPTTVPPTTIAIGEVGLCFLRGDPHIKTFDRERMDKNFYNYGDYWLVKRSDIWVQARYGSTRKDGNSAIRELAISEPRVKGATWIIKAGGEVTDKPCVDDPPAWLQKSGITAARCVQEVAHDPEVCQQSAWKTNCKYSCKACPNASPFTDKIEPCSNQMDTQWFTGTSAEWDQKCQDKVKNDPTLCDDIRYRVRCKESCGLCLGNSHKKHAVSFSFAPNVSITVEVLNSAHSVHGPERLDEEQSEGRTPGFLNVFLEMPRLDEQQSGHCGNFNGNADDDEPSDVMVDSEELLLAPRTWGDVVPKVHHCSDAMKAKAMSHCESALDAIGWSNKVAEIDACVVDYCSVGEQAADAAVGA